MPGVTIRTATRSGPVNPPAPATGRYMVIGQFERGPVATATLVRSMAELAVLFGAQVAYSSAYDDLRVYFEEGGDEAYVVRVAGPAATKGTLTVSDRAGSPAPTVKLDAANAGAWSSTLQAVFTAGRGGASVDLSVQLGGAEVEKYVSLTSPAAIEAALTTSRYLRATNLGSVTVAPNNLPALATYTLSAGSDDRTNITTQAMIDGLTALDLDLGTGAVAIPGWSAAAVGAGIKAHCKANRRVGLLAPLVGQTPAQVITLADSLVGTDVDGAEHVALFYPWIRIPTGQTTTKLVSPEGYVAACRARAHRLVGPWRAGAGDLSAARFVLDTETKVNRADGDRLDDANVNAIRVIQGRPVVYGWRSLSTDSTNYQLLTSRDVLNAIAVAVWAASEPLVFETIDPLGHLTGKLAAACLGVVEPMRAAGGLYPRLDPVTRFELDPGYSVDVGPTVNTVALAGQNKMAAVIAVRPSPSATLVDITIVRASLAATV